MADLLRPAPATKLPGQLLYLTLQGSHAHGYATETSDEDWRAVFQLPNEAFLGLHSPGMTYETPPDFVAWELSHWGRQLLNGNPNLMEMLWAPEDCVAEEAPVIAAIRRIREKFITQRMVGAYRGWLSQEMKVAHDGLPPKRLAHILRLAWELEEVLLYNRITVRMRYEQRDVIKAVRGGLLAADRVVYIAEAIIAHVDQLLRTRTLPQPPVEELEALIIAARYGRLM